MVVNRALAAIAQYVQGGRFHPGLSFYERAHVRIFVLFSFSLAHVAFAFVVAPSFPGRICLLSFPGRWLDSCAFV